MREGEPKEKVKLLQEILEELRGIRAVIAKEYPRDWETCIKEHIRRLDERCREQNLPEKC